MENGSELPQPSGQETLKPNPDFFTAVIPGAPASKKDLRSLYDELDKRLGPENFLYVPSVTSPDAFDNEKDKGKRYVEMAEQIANGLGERKDLVLIGHSMGGAEALLLLAEIASNEKFKDVNIDLVVFSPINYGLEGLKGVTAWVEGSKRILGLLEKQDRDTFEAHVACPLPYEVAQKVSPILSETEGFEELAVNGELRNQRRSLFEQAVMRKELLKDKAVENPNKGSNAAFNRHTLIQRINAIDAELTLQVQSGQNPDKTLLDKRSKLIAPYISTLLDAGYLDPERQRVLDVIHNVGKKPTFLGFLKPAFYKSLAPYAKQIIDNSYKGFVNILGQLNQQLEQKGIKLNTSLVYMRNDRFITVEQAKKTVSEIELKELASLKALAEATHFTVAYQPGLLIDVVEQVTGKKIKR